MTIYSSEHTTGILCGPTSGASYLGTLRYLRKVAPALTQRKTAVFIVCDRLEWYMDYIKARRPHLFGQDAKPGSLKSFEKFSANDSHAIAAEKAQGWIDENDPLIIDVRGNLAFKMTTLPGAINIPWELFETMIDAADPFPKGRPLLLVCPVGEKTARYAAYLQGRGYKAFSLGEGILGWRNNNQRLVKVV